MLAQPLAPLVFEGLGKGNRPDSCAGHVLGREGSLGALTGCFGSVVATAIKACFCQELSGYDLGSAESPYAGREGAICTVSYLAPTTKAPWAAGELGNPCQRHTEVSISGLAFQIFFFFLLFSVTLPFF